MANRDLKNSSRSSRGRSSSSRSGGGGMVAGIVIGLIVGVAVAVGLAMYLNKSSTPFSNLEKLDRKAASASAPPTELLAPGTRIADAASETATAPAPVSKPTQPPSAPPPMPAETPAKPTSAAPAAKEAGKDEQRFDFYKILPGQVDAVPGKNGKAAEPSAQQAAKKVYLQLGSFQNQDEADNLKAKLALLGVEAKIQSVTVPEKGLVHRVRVGPYSRQDEVDRVKAQLKQDGIGATVVKAE
ncbi:SPOR domain-containing protein [Chromobacterium haemolyticum]|uniref:SPOR domain-containing protein n=2 Tax=Chromobacterium fluminis TaxID=3044269 RepID=A0ABX0LBI5_9NEIS|nr:SPOR domain-containing protein [Chromobacterium haemolyticum]